MNNLEHLQEWQKLPNQTKLNIFQETGRQVGLPDFAIEKDWWVAHTLAVIFSTDCTKSLLFKGGTSLSKGWDLIRRFSEDIDLALDREYLGFSGEISKADIRRLRRVSFEFMTNTFTPELQGRFNELGFVGVETKYREVVNHDQDPIIIEIYYPKLTEKESYLKPGLLVEIGCRSLKEPFSVREINTMVADRFSGRPFCDTPIAIPVVNPERTFLEKIFLLHEEFQKPQDKVRVERLSRHLYDIEKLQQTGYAEKALANGDLYNTIIAHREHFTHISGIDYSKHSPKHIRFIPPDSLLPHWEKDYKAMIENMIYGETLSFGELIRQLGLLQARINNIDWG